MGDLCLDGQLRCTRFRTVCPERIRVGSLERPRVYVPERTCRMEYNEEWSGDELYPTECYNCSECHYMTSDGMPNYCPNCGAKVVEEES